MRFNLHQCLLLLLLPLSTTLGARGQTPIVTEDFSSDGEGTRYTSNVATIQSQVTEAPTGGTQTGMTNLHYFMRATDNAPRFPNTTGNVVFGTNANPLPVYAPGTTTAAAPGFWECEGVRASINPATIQRRNPHRTSSC